MADALSRLTTDSTDETEMDYDFLKLSSDDNPPRVVIACFECDHVDAPVDRNTTEPEIIAPVEQEVLITPSDSLKEQSSDKYWTDVGNSVCLPGSSFTYDQDGFLVRQSPIDGAVQRVVTVSLRNRLLYLAHYPLLVGHPGGRRMYIAMHR